MQGGWTVANVKGGGMVGRQQSHETELVYILDGSAPTDG
jgi:hypothetical protein